MLFGAIISIEVAQQNACKRVMLAQKIICSAHVGAAVYRKFYIYIRITFRTCRITESG